MKLDMQHVKPTLEQALLGFFPTATGVGHPNYTLLRPQHVRPRHKLQFSVKLVGPDLVCDFGDLGWDSLEEEDFLWLEELEDYLTRQSLIEGQVILKGTEYSRFVVEGYPQHKTSFDYSPKS